MTHIHLIARMANILNVVKKKRKKKKRSKIIKKKEKKSNERFFNVSKTEAKTRMYLTERKHLKLFSS